MASFNMTVEDSSPLITYAPAGAWDDTPNNDPFASSYSESSFHTTSAQGATATISFNGTGISIFGGQRSNYGAYSISIDGQIIANNSAQTTSDNFRQLLGSASGLSYGSHVAVFTNTNGGPVDIDWIDFETQLSSPGTNGMSTAFIDNSDPSITYSPQSAWKINTNPQFFNQSLSFTQTPGASASLVFSGGAIAVYGTVSPDHADVVVTVDGQSQSMLGGANGFANVVHPKTLLYYQGDLSMTGTHILQMTGNSANAGPFIDLDMIAVYTATSQPDNAATSITTGGISTTGSIATGSNSHTGGPALVPFVTATQATESATRAAESTLPSSTGSPSTSHSSSHPSTGAIVSGVVGGLIAFLLILGLLAFVFLRRRKNTRSKVEKSMISVSPILPMQRSPRTPILPMQKAPRDLEAGIVRSTENSAFPFPVPPQKAASSLRHSIAPSYYSDPAYSQHSRDESVDSARSSSPLVSSGVPRINVPQPRSNINRKPAPARSGLGYTPARPSKRPPTIDFTQMESPR